MMRSPESREHRAGFRSMRNDNSADAAGAPQSSADEGDDRPALRGSASPGRSRPTDSREDASNPRLTQAMEQYLSELEAGHCPDRQQYLTRFADIASELGACLDGLEFVHRVAPQLGQAGDAVDGDCEDSPMRFGGTAKMNPATTLGDFRILREIGRGGMGVVYEAEQVSLQRRVALKVLPFAGILDSRQIARFQNEARAAALLHHENIVPVHGVGCERGVHYYAMQYIEGYTLADLIALLRHENGIGPASEPEETPTASYEKKEERAARIEDGQPSAADDGRPQASENSTDSVADTSPFAALSTDYASSPRVFFRRVAEIGIRIADALEHAHQHGIVHRDVKPSNVLIDSSGKPWITDFGLAQIEADAGLTMTGDLVGTLRYMSPEQASAERGLVDHRSDIYSLGVTLYELLTLRPAFPESDRRKLLQQLLTAEPCPARRMNKAIPGDLETIILKCISKDSRDRFATTSDLAADLRRYLENVPIRARRPSRHEQLLKWTIRHREAVASGLILLIIATIALSITTIHMVLARAEARRNARELNRTATLAVEAAQRESRERRRAEETLDLALQSVEEMYQKLADRWLADQPHSEPMVREFYERARHFYRALSAANAQSPELRHHRAFANYRLAYICQWLGDYDASLDGWRTGLRLYSELASESPPGTPSHATSRQGVARCADGVGFVRRRLLQPSERFPDSDGARESEQACDRAVRVMQELVDEFPTNSEYLSELAHFENNRGLLYRDTGRFNEAEQAFRRVLAIKESVVAKDAQNLHYKWLLSFSHGDLALVLAHRGAREEATRHFRACLELQAALVDAAPKDPGYRHHLIMTSDNYATFLRQTGEAPEEREALLRRAIGVGKGLCDDFPNVPDYGNQLAWILATTAEEQLRDPIQALKYSERAIRSEPGNAAYWNTHGVALCQAGRWSQAVGALHESIELSHGGGPFDWFFLAIAHHQLGEIELGETWHTRAVAWMNQHRSKDEQLLRFQAEAAAILGSDSGRPESRPEAAINPHGPAVEAPQPNNKG